MSSPSGFLVVDKTSGPSSHDIVDAVRSITGEERVGHCGTLDPLASGVLVMCIGSATRLAEYLLGQDKGYRAGVLLGVTTETDDIKGEVVARADVHVTREQVLAALESFRGAFLQTPPNYSARRVDGKRAYKHARSGHDVVQEPTRVTMHALELTAFDPPRLTLELRCSSGTYVRAIARDLGAALGCGATLEHLRRTSAGAFALTDAATIAELTPDPTLWRSRLLPLTDGLRDLEPMQLDAEQSRKVRNGLFVPAPPNLTAPLVRAIAPDGSLVAILRRAEDPLMLRPRKVFKPFDAAGADSA